MCGHKKLQVATNESHIKYEHRIDIDIFRGNWFQPVIISIQDSY